MTSANPIASRVEFDTNGGCWLWTGYLTPQGYGNFRGRPAHRVSYEVYVGPIPGKLYVCHKCDVRACVNPDHLFVGDTSANARDMVAKGRHSNGPPGANNRRMTPAQIAVAMDTSISINEASRRTGFSVTSVRGWRDGSNKTRRTLDALSADAERLREAAYLLDDCIWRDHDTGDYRVEHDGSVERARAILAALATPDALKGGAK